MTIELRDPTRESLNYLYSYKVSDKELDKFSCRELKPFPEFDTYYNNKINNWSEGSIINKVIYNIELGIPIGDITAFDINNRNHSCEFGYYIDKKYRGRGYGINSVSQFIKYLFSEYDFNKVYATTSSNNKASIKILNKLGFKLDGRNREHYWIDGEIYDQNVYSLLRREYNNLLFN